MIHCAMQCTCGTNVTVDTTESYCLDSRWVCLCQGCYDPTDGGGTAGYGRNAEAAICDWWEKVEEEQEIFWMLTPAGKNVTVVVEVWAQAKAEAEMARSSTPIPDLFQMLKKSLEAMT